MQRVSWCIWAGLLLAVLAGAAGEGFLSARVRSDGPMRVHYDAVLRNGNASEVVVELTPSPDGFSLWWSRSFLEELRLGQIVPIPAQSVPRDGGVETRFGSAGSQAVRVVLRMRPETIGSVESTVRSGPYQVVFRQFVLP